MLKIRLQRRGRKKLPAYKIVVAEHTMPIQGRFIEQLGGFISNRKAETLKFNQERILHWVNNGAQVSQTVARLLLKEGVNEMKKFVKQRASKPAKVKEEPKKEEEKLDEKPAEEK
jgi:small subunit ribosomal protein S16